METAAELVTKDLLEQLTGVVVDINRQINEVAREADRLEIPPERLRDGNGNYLMSPLFLAKAQALAAIASMSTQRIYVNQYFNGHPAEG